MQTRQLKAVIQIAIKQTNKCELRQEIWTLCEISRHHGVERYQSTCVRGTPTVPSCSEETGLCELISTSFSWGNAGDATASESAAIESVGLFEVISDGNEKYLITRKNNDMNQKSYDQ